MKNEIIIEMKKNYPIDNILKRNEWNKLKINLLNFIIIQIIIEFYIFMGVETIPLLLIGCGLCIISIIYCFKIIINLIRVDFTTAGTGAIGPTMLITDYINQIGKDIKSIKKFFKRK